MNVIACITSWAQGLPQWQADAVRRLLEKETLSTDEKKEILLMLKAAHGLRDPDSPTLAPRPPQIAASATAQEAHTTTILAGVRDLKNVNSISSAQRVAFSHVGVTVVYGENGSGKSGYARVLKKACRARDTEEVIHPDVFSEADRGGPAEAIFEVVLQGEEKALPFVDGKPSPQVLSNFMVFDAKCSRLQVDKANPLVVVPAGLDLFSRLASLLAELRRQLEEEKRGLDVPPYFFESVPVETAVGTLIRSMSHLTRDDEITALATLSDEEVERLSSLEKTLADLKANDPIVQAEAIRRMKTRIEKLNERLGTIANILSVDKDLSLQRLFESARNAEDAARLASEDAFKNEPLPGTGTNVWKEMFEAARKYSEQLAYPGQPFPVTTTDSRCVLCLQELDTNTQVRLKRFQEFVQAETAQSAQKKRGAFERALKKVSDLDLSPDSQYPELLAEVKELSPEVADSLQRFWLASSAKKAALEKACKDENWDGIPETPCEATVELSGLAGVLDVAIREKQVTAQTDERQKLEKEWRELNTRRILSSHKEGTLAYLQNLRLKDILQRCVDATNTTGITRRGSELTKEVVTGSMQDALNDELQKLGL